MVHITNNLGNAHTMATSGLRIPTWSYGIFLAPTKVAIGATSKSKYFEFSISHLK